MVAHLAALLGLVALAAEEVVLLAVRVQLEQQILGVVVVEVLHQILAALAALVSSSSSAINKVRHE